MKTRTLVLAVASIVGASVLAAGGAILNGCTAQQVPPAVVASVETALCILQTFSADKAAGMTDGAAAADTITRCATDAATIVKVLDASHAAEARLKGADAGAPDAGR